MLPFVLAACLAAPLILLVVDMAIPRRTPGATGPARPAVPADLHRPYAATAARRPAPAPVAPAPRPEAVASRAPRIAPGDGMVYRASRRPA